MARRGKNRRAARRTPHTRRRAQRGTTGLLRQSRVVTHKMRQRHQRAMGHVGVVTR